MHNAFYYALENIHEDDSISLDESITQLTFNAQGLIPVIAQCHESGHVLMQAWMNQAAIKTTLATKKMTYWSRSRNAFWVKGETSGHTQQLVSMRFDCDGDSILCLVKQTGSACHTGRTSCFYLQADADNQHVVLKKVANEI
jgi:phosphoribosyl-AMP cyclohydrolase